MGFVLRVLVLWLKEYSVAILGEYYKSLVVFEYSLVSMNKVRCLMAINFSLSTCVACM